LLNNSVLAAACAVFQHGNLPAPLACLEISYGAKYQRTGWARFDAGWNTRFVQAFSVTFYRPALIAVLADYTKWTGHNAHPATYTFVLTITVGNQAIRGMVERMGCTEFHTGSFFAVTAGNRGF
jgi:hypothetical protein